MGHAFAMGAEKHGPYSFRDEPIEYTELIDSLMRHTLAFLDGEDLDPESGLPHTYHILANAAMLEYTRVNAPEKDDRPKKKASVPSVKDFKKVLVKDYDNEDSLRPNSYWEDPESAGWNSDKYVELSKPKKYKTITSNNQEFLKKVSDDYKKRNKKKKK